MTAAASGRLLVGREDELAAVADRLDPGSQHIVVLHGEAGIGKTSLWLAGLAAAERRGCRVLSCRPSEAEARFAYAGLADLLDGAAEEVVPALPPVQRRALETALLLGEPDARVDERAVAAAWLGALRSLAAESPVCVGVDDVQWLDDASLAALRFALPRLDDARVGWLLAARGEVPGWLRGVVSAERVTALELRGLSLGALHELLRGRLGRSLPRPTLVRLREASGGNAFFALELAQALERRGFERAPGDPLPLPSSLDDLLRERLDGLGAEALDVATTAAALSDPTPELLGAALGDVADVGLPDALDARILELDGARLRFSHPLLASAVTGRQSHAARRALHGRLARIAPTHEERARHLAAATVRPDPAIARVLEEAARAAHARGAPLAAAELADEALRLTPAEARADRRRRLLHAADRYYVAAHVDRATSLLRGALDDSPPGRERAVVLIRLSGMTASAREGADLLEAALADAEGEGDLVAEIHLRLAGSMRFVDGVERGLEHAELAVAAAPAAGDAELRCRALASAGLLAFNAGRGLSEPEMAEALSLERSLPGWPLEEGPAVVLAHQLVWSGEVGRARDLLLELDRAFSARGDVPSQARALWYLALTEWRAGRWAEADRLAAASHELTRQVGLEDVTAGFPTEILDAHLGRVEPTRASVRAALERAREEQVLISELSSSWVLGALELALGDPVSALPLLRRAHELRDATFVLEPGMRFELGDLVEALVATDALAEAERALDSVEPRARRLDRAWALAVIARSRGLVHAARGELDQALTELDRSLAEHGRCDDPFQHARSLLALGRTQRRAKRRGVARATLEGAVAGFEALGARLWAERARDELGRIGGRAPSRRALTEAERRIAGLVADGRTNREVAAALFLTEHSVETALSRIYRKLGIHSRRELGRALSNS